MKKETIKFIAAALIAFAACLFMAGCLSVDNSREPDIVRNLMTQSGELVFLTAGKGYSGIAKYYEPDSSGIFTKLALVVFKDGQGTAYDMVSVPAASGAKFSTHGAEYVLWESKGEFSFFRGDAETLLAVFTIMPEQRTSAVELDGNPTTGFSWVYSFSREGIIREASAVYVPDAAGERIAGSGGKFIFSFEAIACGETEITFSYLRVWEEGVPAQETVVYKAIVDENNYLSLVRQ